MQTLCFFTNLTSAEWAAWVQAIGSILAIIAAAWIAIHQAKLQHQNALQLHITEQQSAKLDIANTLFVLATNSSIAMKHISGQLKDRESIYQVAEGLIHCDIGELQRIDAHLNAIPLHSIPSPLVTPTMVLGATLRQFKDKAEMALRAHRQMDAAMFEDFFRTIEEMNTSATATSQDIQTEIKNFETKVA